MLYINNYKIKLQLLLSEFLSGNHRLGQISVHLEYDSK